MQAIESSHPRFVQFVIKVSKLCNLRCKYCYEFKELGNRAAMSRAQLRRLYENAAAYYGELDRRDGRSTELRFIWHGGEPLLMPPEFYRETFEDQREVLGAQVKRLNIVQTNLTRIDDERIELLRDGFHSVGVSIDLFGDLRVDAGGRPSQDTVLTNMETLRRRGVKFGAITVLTRKNIANVRQIHEFYERSKIPFRILPLFDGAWDGQHVGFEVSTEEILSAFRTLVDLWFESDEFIDANPIVEYVQMVLLRFSPDAQPRYYRRREWIPTILVNTNGDCYSYGDPYGQPEWSFGNIFEVPLQRMSTSPAFERSAHESEKRIAANCLNCPYFGACDGYPIAEDTTNCRETNAAGIRVCVFERQLMAHIEQRLRERNLINAEGRLALSPQLGRRLGMESSASPSQLPKAVIEQPMQVA